MEKMTIAIGYDHVEAAAWHVLVQSIMQHSSIPVEIIPIKLSLLQHYYDRERDPLQSNEFAFSRWLAPYLASQGKFDDGWVLFMDCDMLFRDDPAKLWALRDDNYSVMVCKHDYEPTTDIKFLGAAQTKYPRKNWASVMLMNIPKCSVLTPEYVTNNSGLHLHQFKWLEDDQIGEIPPEWNWLEGEYEPNPYAKNVHWTIGGPYFAAYANCFYGDEWWKQMEGVINCNCPAPPLKSMQMVTRGEAIILENEDEEKTTSAGS
jgi:hypothetical protein